MAWWHRFIGGSSPSNDIPGTVSRADSAVIPAPHYRMDSIVNSVTGFGGVNDSTTASRPDVGRQPLTIDELRALNLYNPYASTIVSRVPFDCTRAGWTVSGLDVEEDEQRLELQSKVRNAMEKARLFGGAFLMIVTDNEAMDTPLPARLGAVSHLVILERQEVTVKLWDGIPQSPRFRLPEVYEVNPVVPAGFIQAIPVHWSRMAYFDGIEVDAQTRSYNQGYGNSILQKCWDAIRNLTTDDQAGAVIMRDLNIDVLAMKSFQALTVGDQAAGLEMRLKAIARSRSMLGTVVMEEGEIYQRLAMNTQGFEQVSLHHKEALACAAEAMPMTLLFGQTPGGLSTDGQSQEKNWNKWIEACQISKCLPGLKQIYNALARVQGVDPDSVNIYFNPLDNPSTLECAQAEKALAEADDIRIGSGALTPQEVRSSRYSPESDGDIYIEEGDIELPADEEIAAMATLEPLQVPVPDPNAA